MFNESAPTLIQSSSCNVHFKDEALKPLCNSKLESENVHTIFVMCAAEPCGGQRIALS